MQPLISAVRQQLQQLGWKDGRIHIDSRSAIVDAARTWAGSERFSSLKDNHFSF
jgi:hypothetical protein